MALYSVSGAMTAAFAAASLFTTSASAASSGTYNLVADYQGSTFFNGFETYTGPDPTHGHVNYTDMAFAASSGLLGFNQYPSTNETRAFIKVDSTNKAPTGRNAVRLTSTATFSVGMLAVMDIAHQPVAPGIWPAAWFLGTGGVWPAKGEIDVVEYVSNSSTNLMTLHTAPGCSVANSSTAFVGSLQAEDCNSGNAANGCSTRAPSSIKSFDKQVNTAGEAFNKQGGAIYVTEWTASGINVWAFARSAVPSSLNSINPSTAGFPTPLASFSGSGCDFSKTFQDMVMIVNTDMCGDFVGKTWGAMEWPRKPAFADAYWEFGSIKIYSSGAKPGKNPGKRSIGEEASVNFSTVVIGDSADQSAVNATSIARRSRNATATPAFDGRRGGRSVSAAGYGGAAVLRSASSSDAPSTESKLAAFAAVFVAMLVFAALL